MKNHFLAEALGTCALVFAGCGAIVVNDLYGGVLGHVGVSLVFGLIVMAMIYAMGNISGAHFNPAVTIGFFCAGRLAGNLVLPYVASQLAGGILGAAFLWFLFPEHIGSGLGFTQPSGTLMQAFVMELLLTFFLMLVILNVSTGHMEKGIMAGVAVGGTVALEALIGGPVTGASMNPARSIAPALMSGQFQHLWLYIAAPITGAVLAFPFCKWVQGSECCSESQDNS